MLLLYSSHCLTRLRGGNGLMVWVLRYWFLSISGAHMDNCQFDYSSAIWAACAFSWACYDASGPEN